MEFQKGGLWRNWVGNQTCVPRYKAAPNDEAMLVEMVRKADALDLPIRCAGSGHSFTPVVGTGGLLLSLGAMRGLQNVDRERKRVTVMAGTRIGDVGRLLKGL